MRAFNSVLDAEILRAYIVLVLAVSQQALTQKTASPKPLMSDYPRYTFRCWLIRMGLNGEEFQSVRKILLERMEGTIVWRHPEQLIAAREPEELCDELDEDWADPFQMAFGGENL